jgi:hypothetical protein
MNLKNILKSNKMTIPRSSDDVESYTYKNIKMRVGIHKRTWVGNVIAIGLSAGFIEPLESNGLFTVHEFLLSASKSFRSWIYIHNGLEIFITLRQKRYLMAL